MIDHVTLTVSDIQTSRAFYDAALAPLGMERLFDDEYYSGYGVDRPVFWISEDAEASKTHIAFTSQSQKAVQQFYTAALAAGGKDNGAPGPRPEYHEQYYAAFILDPDGNNIEAVFGNA